MCRLVLLASLLAICLGAGEAAGDAPVEDRVAVPDVRGLEPGAARRRILDAGLRPGRTYDRAVPAGAPVGVVLQQAPPPDTAEKPSRRAPGSEVHLRIAVAEKAPAIGSPEPAPVPPITGLLLVEAEQLCRQRGLALHVDRVAGHPVGRILSQDPAAGALPPPGDLIRVRVAAGGDAPAAIAPAPTVEVTRLAVPDLLDRTWPQAQRILAELGFEARREEAAHGPPDRVADQIPEAGAPLERGETVMVRIAPPRAARPPAPSLPSVPRPIAPGPSAELGDAATLLLGFAWHPVPGADAYVVEVEEAVGTEWLGIVRQVVRRSAVVLDVERLSRPPGGIRWRVAAVEDSRPASPCAWTEIR